MRDSLSPAAAVVDRKMRVQQRRRRVSQEGPLSGGGECGTHSLSRPSRHGDPCLTTMRCR